MRLASFVSRNCVSADLDIKEEVMQKTVVLSTMRFTDELLDKLRAVSPRLVVKQRDCRSAEEVEQALEESVEVLYTSYLPADLSRAPRLKWVQMHIAGIDNLLDHPIMKSDTLFTTASGIHATTIAEYVFASILAFNRRIPRMLYYQKRHEWPRGRWKLFARLELRGSTLGIVGYGSIGREVGRIARCFGMRVVATKRSVSQMRDMGYAAQGTGDREGALLDEAFPPERLSEMLGLCDYVVVAVPLTPETRKLIGEAELRAMKPSAYLVNISRGGTLDERALIKALQEGLIAGAGLDVFEEEPLPSDSLFYDLENVILSPHVSGFTLRYDERASDLFAENLRRYLAGEPLLNLVDKERGY
jgi:phosphoglycerate dehydrogenase-like enzyme